ncbi:hypothetical protein KAR91_11330 [Candidatus Pacearchaeota archaeon]|nr:hypothetical protein [Candidatus Pacearchaeota archaeon]
MENWDFIEFVKSQDTFRIVCLGVTRSGKTFWCKRLLRSLMQYKKLKIFIVDPKYEFDNWKDFTKLDLLQQSFIRKIQIMKWKGERYEKASDIAEFLASFAWNFPPSMLYIEELPESIKQSENLPTSHPLVYKVLQQGAGRRTNIMVASQMINQTNWAFIRQSSDIFVFAVKPPECRAIEKGLALEPKSIKFDLPTKKEFKAGTFKELYTFYHIDTLSTPVHYKKIPKTPSKKKPKLSQKK